MPGGGRIVERGREWVLRSKPIVDCRDSRLRRRCEPPGDVTVELRRSDDITAAVQEQEVAIGVCVRCCDAQRCYPAQFAALHLGAGGRHRRPARETRGALAEPSYRE